MEISVEPTLLPQPIAAWFSDRGWSLRPHQIAALNAARAGHDALVIAPTGGGKTLAGFLPSLAELTERGPVAQARLNTLYISPLKALSVDVARNLQTPVADAGLPVKIETRTGDTPQARRARQFRTPPDILLTTPEQVALMLAHPAAADMFADLRHIVIDEIHAIAPSKRGDLLALGLARLSGLAPEARRIGLSATVADPNALRRWLAPQPRHGEGLAELIEGPTGAQPRVSVLIGEARIPWSGHFAGHAVDAIYDAVKASGMTLLFVNTRSQAEFLFQRLWERNDDGLAIALHHGSLDVERRRKVEAAMAAGALKAVVCTSTLDLGIDWGDVDLVVQIGAPKGAARLTQRIGRANHRMDEPSAAVLVPGNRFEVLECEAAREAVSAGALDGEALKPGSLDILCQHLLGMGCSAPFDADQQFFETRLAAPYADLSRNDFDRALDFVATGGYALRVYDRHKRLVQDSDGRWRVRNGEIAQRYRMNLGAIVEAPSLDVRLTTARRGPNGRVRAGGGRAGRRLGQIEEWFVEQLAPGDTFLFAGEVLRFEGLAETDALVSRAPDADPKVPTWQGGKFPLSTYLADRVRKRVSDPDSWADLPEPVREWLELQRVRSLLPAADELLVETFPYGGRHFLVCFPFDGRLAHQTLGMLLTRRLERMDRRPLGFVATEYALSVWGLRPMDKLDLDALFHQDMLGDDLEAWLDESALMKRTFRNCAVIAGMIERRQPGHEKTGRQVTFSTDLIYDVLRSHQPDHILLEAAWRDAAGGYLDLARLAALLQRVAGRMRHQPLERPSPLAVPVMLEIGREPVYGQAEDDLLGEAAIAADALIAAATRP